MGRQMKTKAYRANEDGKLCKVLDLQIAGHRHRWGVDAMVGCTTKGDILSFFHDLGTYECLVLKDKAVLSSSVIITLVCTMPV